MTQFLQLLLNHHLLDFLLLKLYSYLNLRKLIIIVSIEFLMHSLIVLYDIYYEYKSAKELWTALEHEYNLNDVGIERFTSSFNKFMMTDSKPIND